LWNQHWQQHENMALIRMLPETQIGFITVNFKLGE
jgi:hypothetical protein